jgi:dihydrofolate reductase
MAKLIYLMNASLDGYTEDEQGRFDFRVPEDPEAHVQVCNFVSQFHTCLYGRKMYDKMVYWETAPTAGSQPQFLLDFAKYWQAAEKIVYSRTLATPNSARTRIEREFDPEAVRRLKADAKHDMTVNGPELAAQAVSAGLVDELQMIVWPVVVGGGKRFFADGVRLDLELIDERRLGKGVIVLRYAVVNRSKL